ncbi:MAG: phosphodiesterase [Phototrophicales bacterium]|nr:MAG: phosphodiesterase [Phototrophicales bacterium]
MMRLFRRKPKKVMLIGLDCASPDLIFHQLDLPNIRQLMSSWGKLESSIPCITVPAWASMTTGRDAGELGVYGFRNRADYSYNPMTVVNGSAIKAKRVWDYIGEAGKDSLVMAVPQTYPPRPIRGHLLSGFLTPGISSGFTYPAIFKQEVLKLAPAYPFDVKDFRTDDKAALLQRLFDLRETQFKVAFHMLKAKPWDFFMHVDIGLDRLHHGFWRFHDPTHRFHNPNSPFKNAVRDYYTLLDEQIGQMVEAAPDNTAVMIVSDHGVKRMDGGICLNEWLWREGWLHLEAPPPQGTLTRFEDLCVDWRKTRAWGAGGYYGRVFLNVQGREPSGVIPPESYETIRDELATQLKSIPGIHGDSINTCVMKPQEIYRQINGVAPDLLVYFGDLHYRAIGSLGHNAVVVSSNDTGPDDANHDTHGVFILHDPQSKSEGEITGMNLLHIMPQILNLMGIAITPIT